MDEDYKLVRDIISLDLASFLASRLLSRRDELEGDCQVARSQSVHSKAAPVFKHLLHYLRPRIESEIQTEIESTYAYARIYLPGAVLPRHVDRAECEISCTITLKTSYFDKRYRWPLYINEKPVVIPEGTGVIYKGCEVLHARPVFRQPPPSYHVQVFLHYVRKKSADASS